MTTPNAPRRACNLHGLAVEIQRLKERIDEDNKSHDEHIRALTDRMVKLKARTCAALKQQGHKVGQRFRVTPQIEAVLDSNDLQTWPTDHPIEAASIDVAIEYPA